WRAKEIAKLSVPAGILSGIVAGLLYNRFSNIKLPDYLAFFAGRRFVPIAAGFAGVVGAALFGFGFPWFEGGIDALSQWVVSAGPLGLFLYGLLNRLLLITGLHHIINNIAWFILGDFHGATGDLKRFFAGDPTAGSFMAGFFPVMMFGLPAACLAMYRNALPERRKAVGGLFLSLALTSLLTGVTEPVEFTFIFLAPLLAALATGGDRGGQFVAALGGAANLKTIDACTTRLRLDLADPAAVDEAVLKALGARGIVRPGGNTLQVVLGPIADQVAGEIRAAAAIPTADNPIDRATAIIDVLASAGIRAVRRC